MNIYPLITTSVFHILDGQKAESVQGQFEAAKGILEKSQRLDMEIKEQLMALIDEVVVMATNNSEELIDQIHNVRNTLVDFVINLQEAALYESNKP